LQVLGATTLDEHRKHIEKDAALERRFQPVFVDEPTEAETLTILQVHVDLCGSSGRRGVSVWEKLGPGGAAGV
jgi:hypothetical protein